MTEIYNQNLFKYTYSIIEQENEMFIFELVLTKFNKSKQITFRCTKNSRSGKLVSFENKIHYDEIKKICISAIDLNNPLLDINVNCLLNQHNKYTIILKNNIFIEFYEFNGFLESNYNIINI